MVNEVSTLAGYGGDDGEEEERCKDGEGINARFGQTNGITVDKDGNIFVADGHPNYCIRKVTPLGVVTTLAGSARRPGYKDGTGTDAQFDDPAGLAMDGDGNIFVADSHPNHCIRKVTPQGVV
eukprot:CAMPEP_0118928050 /NCGR_PEP_ID=MMETSP1169-20130426/5395_1 /TAXON_ID=36882 /ORGANISM="Pyramimonas obovata, Strain CCMP722" /LENGTH=122 /DNA_ID=CAMNT_0006869945 /DNA_START=206 /DNA_END=570 /DNA_ORIENTATION=+